MNSKFRNCLELSCLLMRFVSHLYVTLWMYFCLCVIIHPSFLQNRIIRIQRASILWRSQNNSAPVTMSILLDLSKCRSANFSPDVIKFSFNRNDVFDTFLMILGKMKYEIVRRKLSYLAIFIHVLCCTYARNSQFL